MRFIPLLVLLSAACGTPTNGPMNDQGTLRLCLGSDDLSIDISYDSEGMHSVFSIEGTVAEVDDDALFSIVTCTGRDPLIVQIDDGPTRWWLGIDARDGTGATFIDALDANVGDTLSAAFLVELGWSMDNALLIRDDTGVVFAGEEGYGATLSAEALDLDSLSFTAGETYGRPVQDDCGRKTARTLEVGNPRGPVFVEVGLTESINTPGDTLDVSNVAAWEFGDDLRCTDTWGPMSWVAARPLR